MTASTDLPLRLYKANLELNLRVNQLLQQSAQQWLDLGARLVGDGVAESDAEADQLARAGDWQSLASLPGEAFWRQLQQRFGDVQTASQIAISTQTLFARGLQEALRAWQKDTTLALGGSGEETSLDAAWKGVFESWQSFLPGPAGTEESGRKPTPGVRRGK